MQKHWQQCFHSNRAKVKQIYDEKFCRMWEYYLACSEISFRHSDSTVFQIQLVKERYNIPMTRDYITNQDVDSKNSTTKRIQAA